MNKMKCKGDSSVDMPRPSSSSPQSKHDWETLEDVLEKFNGCNPPGEVSGESPLVRGMNQNIHKVRLCSYEKEYKWPSHPYMIIIMPASIM